MSIVIQPALIRLTDRFSLSMLVALSCCDLLQQAAELEAVIKWPNDIYIGDRKAGGILIENLVQGSDWLFAVIGIGINVNQLEFPPELPNPVSLHQATGRRHDILLLARQLAACIDNRLAGYPALEPGELLADYNRKLYKLNQPVMLRKENISFQAEILGVSAQGRLLTRHAIEQEFDWGEIEWKLVVPAPS